MFLGEVLGNVDNTVHLFVNLWREEATFRVQSQAGSGMSSGTNGVGGGGGGKPKAANTVWRVPPCGHVEDRLPRTLALSGLALSGVLRHDKNQIGSLPHKNNSWAITGWHQSSDCTLVSYKHMRGSGGCTHF